MISATNGHDSRWSIELKSLWYITFINKVSLTDLFSYSSSIALVFTTLIGMDFSLVQRESFEGGMIRMKQVLRPTIILEYVLLILLAGLFLFPTMIWMVVSAMKQEADVYKI